MIYLSKKREVILKIIIFLFLFVFVVCLSYFLSYIKYDNRKCVDGSILMVDNQRLKKELLDIGDVSYKDSLIAKVILRDMYDFYGEIVINIGSDDGVIVNDAVVNEDGLIGIVYKVKKNKSYVVLLSGNYNVTLRIGYTYGNLNKLFITMLDKYSDVEIGDKVYTSGLDEVAGDIYIGEVKEIFIDKEGLGKEAKIELVDNNNLNYVYIVGKIQ